ncbi:LacI family DNA-binding transcriptional regulator [Stagnihabitans tardus]|uniref:Substrate-binding domain-containing protein n=1 Tax=Stagnihabitans tardus TaxID=2699202 RepID=A0AAE5BWA7_9RHOB|nr:substrate-binding domain-containing protein [Stagnihabitans tardus]
MARRATIQDLADQAGVSVSTIDRILNGRAKVRPMTAAKVLEVAEALNFYALPTLRDRLMIDRPKPRLGFLLQQSHRTFYRLIAQALREQAQEVEVVIEHMDDLSPEAVSARMLEMGESVQALAVVSAEHARISHAIETLSARGVPCFGLISELTSTCPTGYIGLDNWRVGRTAAWAITGLCRNPGRVGMLVGNHRYRCQELNEQGFRSYVREHGPGFTILEPLQTFEDKSIARDVTEELLRREPDLTALYVSGGGMVGVLEALKAAGRRGIVTVGHEITDHTRMGLIDHDLSLVMAHPIQRLAAEALTALQAPPAKRIIGFDLFTPENV